MSRYGGGRDRDRHSSGTRLYVGHLSSRTRSRDLEDLFSRYGRVHDVDMKRDYAFVDFGDTRDAEDARYSLNGRDVDGSRIIVEFSRGTPRGPGGARDRDRDHDFGGRGPPPGSGRCFNCGLDGHWARDCKAGDWKNKCYRCGERGHVERNCQNSPKKLRGRSVSRSPSPRRRVASPRRGRSRSHSLSRSRSYSQSRSPPKRDRAAERKSNRSRSPPPGRSPKRHKGSSLSPSRSPKRHRGSPVSSRGRKRSPSPEGRDPRSRNSPSPRDEKRANGSDYGGSPSPRAKSRSPIDEAEKESPRNGGSRSPYEGSGGDRSPSPVARNGRLVNDDVEGDYHDSPRGSE